jgi:hypothetical protein
MIIVAQFKYEFFKTVFSGDEIVEYTKIHEVYLDFSVSDEYIDQHYRQPLQEKYGVRVGWQSCVTAKSVEEAVEFFRVNGVDLVRGNPFGKSE